MQGGHHTMHVSMEGSSRKMGMSGNLKAQSRDCSFSGTLMLAMIIFASPDWPGRFSLRLVLPDI